MKRLLKLIKYICLLLVILIVLSFVIVPGKFGKLHGPYDVVRVVDGDTLIIDIDGEEVRTRVANVNSEESVADESYKENTENGREASKFTKGLMTGKKVYLEYDLGKQDKYGRTLAYVYTVNEDGSAGPSLEEILLKEGMAETMFIFPNIKYALYFKRLELIARLTGAGQWY